MVIIYLSGAYKNAGDFLIEKRAVEIIQYAIPDAQINRFLRKDIEDNIENINKGDCVVIGGGPIYGIDLSKNIPMDFYINNIKLPTMILGGGWYGDNGSSYAVHHYKFEPLTKCFLNKIYASGFGFSCRDLHTVNVLKNEGFSDVLMTGCPAWYDLENIDKTELRSKGNRIRKIAVSDPAKIYNIEGSIYVVQYLKRRFPHAEIVYVFHRGIICDKYTSDKASRELQKISNQLKKLGVYVEDISYSVDGFKIYDNCDLHIGYRVHAHIYNLSIRSRSILIEEDGRGSGVNKTLGLPSIKAYSDKQMIENKYIKKIYVKTPYYRNENIVNELDTYLDILEKTDYQYLKNAFRLQNKYFKQMIDYIRKLKKRRF